MRTVGFPVRLGIGVLAVTLVYAGGTAASGGADSSTTRELATAQGTNDLPIATAAMSGDATSAGTARSGYMVVSGRSGSH